MILREGKFVTELIQNATFSGAIMIGA